VVENGEVEVPFIGPQREQSGRPMGFGGGVSGGWPLRGGEREATGQCRFNGEIKGGDSALRFNSFQVREGDGRQRAAWQRRSGRWWFRRCPMNVTTPGSLTGWAHLSARGRRRPNRISGAGDGRIRQAEQATAESDKRSRPGSLTGWAHLSASWRRRPNRTSSEREATTELDKQREGGDELTRPDREGADGPRLG
jgi:hypothetical protein